MSATVNLILGVVGAQGVLSALDGVRGALGGLATTALGTTSALAGLSSGIALGGEMADLSARTTQSTRDLVVFRRALDNAGVGGNNAAQYIGLLQKAISGLNEEGGKTGDVFKRLQIDPVRLRELGVQEQVTALTSGFARIQNPAERAALAMQLFGRSGAQMLQLLGDSTALVQAERDAGRLAQRLQEDATAFDEVGDRLSIAKVRMQEFWVVAAEKALPTLRAIAGVLESINPAALAAAASSILSIFAFGGTIKLADKMNTAIWTFATNPQVNSAGQTFAQRFIAPLTAGLLSTLRTVLPFAIAGLIGSAIIQGIAQAKTEAIAAEVAAGNAAAKETQRQRDALRHAQSMAEIDAQRKKTAEDIAALEKLATTQQIGTRTRYDSENGRAGRSEQIPIIGLTPLQTQQLAELRRLQQTLASDRPAAIVAANQQAAAEAEKLAKAKELVAELTKQADTYRAAAETARYAIANDQERLRLLDEQKTKAEAQFRVDSDAATLTGDKVAATAAQEKHDAAILAIAKERRTVEQSITEEKKRQADATAAALEKARQAQLELLQSRAQIAQLASEDRQLEIQQQLANLQADYGRTDAEKWAERRQLLAEAVAAAQQYLATMKELRDTASTPESKQLGDAAVHNAQQELVGAQNQLAGAGPNPDNIFDQMRASLTSLRAEWGTTAQQIGGALRGTIGTAVGSISSGISGLILRTTTWRQALANVGTTILTTVIESLVQLGVRWVAQQIIMATVGKAVQAASVAASVPMAMASSAIWAAPATLATIATFGGAAVAAPGFIAGSMATTQLLAAVPGFSDGGYTGDTGGIVHQREFVFSAPAVRNIGLDRLEELHATAKSGASGDGGGDAAGASPGGRDRRIIVVAPDMVSARQLARDPEFENVIVDVMRRRRGEALDS